MKSATSRCDNFGGGSWAILVMMQGRPRLAEDKLDELVELFSERIEGMRAEVTRCGSKVTKHTNKLACGFSCTMRT